MYVPLEHFTSKVILDLSYDINFIISIIVSRLTLAPPGNVIELTESIRSPRGLKKTKTSLH